VIGAVYAGLRYERWTAEERTRIAGEGKQKADRDAAAKRAAEEDAARDGDAAAAAKKAADAARKVEDIAKAKAEAEAVAWEAVKGSTSIPVLEDFLTKHPDSSYADLARTRIAEVKKQVATAEPPPKPVTPSQPTIPPQCDGIYVSVGASAQRCMKPGAGKTESFKDCPECPEMVVIPAGEFMMGSNDGAANERPVHKVTIGWPLAVGKFAATFAEWDACVTGGGCNDKSEDQDWGRGRQPVIVVSWDDVSMEYLPWLTRMTGETYRLLTEAEWEYAARALSTTAYFWGDEIGKGNANCDGCGSQWDNKQTAPVGSFAANAFGLRDMLGNVSEWVQDCYKNTYAGAPPDGRLKPDIYRCPSRVLRGGSWYGSPRSLRSASRFGEFPGYRNNSIGFRVARAISPELNQDRLSEAAEAWAAVKDTTSIPVLEEFITKYPDSSYADLARARIVELKRQASEEELKRQADAAKRKVEGEAATRGRVNAQPNASPVLGLVLSPLNDELRTKHGIGKNVKGVIVLEVDPASTAAEKGMKVGYVIVEAEYAAVTSLDYVSKITDKVKKAGRKNVLLRVERGKDDFGLYALPVGK
jgi:formylglycine-generating enzyme required for sulfatase activity